MENPEDILQQLVCSLTLVAAASAASATGATADSSGDWVPLPGLSVGPADGLRRDEFEAVPQRLPTCVTQPCAAE